MDNDQVVENSFAREAEMDENTNSGSGWLPICIGAFGIILGITGIVMANNASQKLQAMTETFEAKMGESVGVSAKLQSLEEGLERVGASYMTIDKTLKSLSSKMDRKDRDLGKIIGDNRSAINALNSNVAQYGEAIKKITERLSSAPAPRVAVASRELASGSGSTTEESSASSSSATGIYKIQRGDTLGKVAKKYGVTVTQIMDANPGIEPTRLQLGQKVLIPE